MRRMLAGRIIALGCVSYAVDAAAAQVVGQSVRELSSMNVLNWLLALAIVLGIFFACVWMLRKLNSGNGLASTGKMHVVGGVALGLREKVVLLQVGTKQLVLAVTPGRIETLTVLEGDECLANTTRAPQSFVDTPFAQQLMQALKGRSGE